MITALRGEVRRAESDALILGVGPLDVRVLVPSRTAFAAAVGSSCELYTHLQVSVREGHVVLYGFESPEALEAFELLLSVSGVGPKGGLSLLSTFEPGDLRQAIAGGDTSGLARAPGVGSRAAARIVTDLQPKLGATAANGGSGPHGLALQALVDLGYSPAEASRALARVSGDGSPEELIRAALGFLAEGSSSRS